MRALSGYQVDHRDAVLGAPFPHRGRPSSSRIYRAKVSESDCRADISATGLSVAEWRQDRGAETRHSKTHGALAVWESS